MTWNRSEIDLKKLLDDANTCHPNIKLEYKISKSLPFLDVVLTNNNGMLSTSVYHNPAAEPYVAPFISDHPRHTFDNVIQTSLTRAPRNSSTFEIFNNERIYIKLTLLYNGCPSSFIEKQFQKFFSEYINSSSFLPFIDNETQFVTMRNKIRNLPTARQSQVSISAATADIDNDQTDEPQNEPTVTTTATTTVPEQKKKEHTRGNKLIVHYTHEKRFQTFKSDTHQVYDNTFKDTPAADVKLIVGNKNRRSAKTELICKRPKQSILIYKPFKSYPNYQGFPIYQSNRRNFIPRNNCYNRNYNRNYMPLPQYTNYDMVNQPPIMQRRSNQGQQQQRRQSCSNRPQNRSRNGSNQQQRQRSQSRQRPQQQQRRNRPRQLRLNDFMPTEFRDPSPTTTSNLPSEFNLGATTTTEAAAITTAPPDALPQRERFAATTTTTFDTNNTQPFIVNQQQQSTTSSYRRQTRRGKQQRYRSTSNENNNRFALLNDDNDNDNDVVEINAPIVTRTITVRSSVQFKRTVRTVHLN
ncbi:unnamed protein product [Rotaria socialis]|uniref:Helix-turn-helix domain-containing protein n=1 Tax=Rotaria socialis TaxID=392032 RepID=A0A820X6F3_9BILA|nr:unnamed protein product [Rotaria socialis]CAF4525303.1 unnamed protein product [Rotaria socialis]CAF4843515.1 unnamed protein product [Rotaria socialis]